MIHLYRLMFFFHNLKLYPVAKLLQALIFILFNSKVTGDTIIGKKTYFVCKGISVVLIPGTVIGNNCVIGLRFSTVRKFPYKDVPKIMDNVWCGPNCVVAGPVVIENDVIIGANSFVNKSVPAGAIVAGNPAEIIGWTKDLEYNIFDNPKYKEGTMPYLKSSIL
jgi:serine O-acetyltransferase